MNIAITLMLSVFAAYLAYKGGYSHGFSEGRLYQVKRCVDILTQIKKGDL